MEKDTINTNSWMFKLYSARMIREGGCWDVGDVLSQPVDICSYARNIFLQVNFLFFREFILKLFFSLIVVFMVITPILSIGFWLATDNPFILWFGVLGHIMMVVDAAILVLVALGAIASALSYLKTKLGASIPDDSRTMSNYKVATTWVKSTHG